MSKRVFVAACPHCTLEQGPQLGLVCYVEHIRTRLEAGQGFWGDALIVVQPEYKGQWNKRPLQLTEWALCSNDKVQRLWENLFFFFLGILTYLKTTVENIPQNEMEISSTDN